ncbi:hypothetical protein [Abyssalbus ytuae]|uniref:DoxX family protein n=1 Tax=Abyssalbus ytuae TaxID=2926907 RepID=A0A9E7CSV8_9FLAO|nr:hypothetical protein [Abyssalbus ytuae]UOB16931.1 hypothetical protein MQE35_14470 [Abyssalbus ytuae]
MDERKIYVVYSLSRLFAGVIMMGHGMYNAFNFKEYVHRVEVYFTKLDFFNNSFLYHTSPFVPFEEFTLGLFLVMGFKLKMALRLSVVLYTFLILFLLDAGAYNLIPFHIVLMGVFLILDYSHKYNYKECLLTLLKV